MKIAFAKPYEECIDEKATLKVMRQHLKFLSRYAYLLEDRETQAYLVEEEDLLSYLPYSKSVIDIQANPSSLAHSTKLLMAIEKCDQQKEEKRRLREERRLRCLWLMQGILVLPEPQKQAILYKYIQHLDQNQILRKMNQISNSTLQRILMRACLDLAQILEIEILKKEKVEGENG